MRNGREQIWEGPCNNPPPHPQEQSSLCRALVSFLDAVPCVQLLCAFLNYARSWLCTRRRGYCRDTSSPRAWTRCVSADSRISPTNTHTGYRATYYHQRKTRQDEKQGHTENLTVDQNVYTFICLQETRAVYFCFSTKMSDQLAEVKFLHKAFNHVVNQIQTYLKYKIVSLR